MNRLLLLSGLVVSSALTAVTIASVLSIPARATPPESSAIAQEMWPWRSGFPNRMGNADQHFIVMMIPHHEGAIAMADLAISQAKHPELQALARAIQTSQTQEVRDMQTWYRRWYGSTVPDWDDRRVSSWRNSGMPSIGMGCAGRAGLATDLIALQAAPDFDRAFIEMMIPHHEMGVRMAQMVLLRSDRPEIQRLAQAIITDQNQEIRQMQQWYRQWYS
ncbi:DUF305 domain-containing protein [Synechococcus elongatus]|uniref:DUF305 domain-containing protein n=2 Tax=Synechococcus elongatus TaxID=32046 RepID=Q31P39_SYNE7|nr:DUF305 domain-containing protein [Synechococcus elongatus]AAN40831.1 unknown [Synechococcus elongatus PCC 7942 = FACHB-805]ABB57180.1 conserved hypothetical protein [Synechococcus elongatus PCC 7942 = FACHB-805]AJD58306.1 hypothetical protein M744_10900 [Synechococcus elongatus UTEX 2973]MBD2587584.1 DUF305 domain-containing protein [Synechococcus elongatus FACHB-242]MBD2688637.1 DUF305 domain-containing protein [Synechococcus elongatus FACHB-1061]